MLTSSSQSPALAQEQGLRRTDEPPGLRAFGQQAIDLEQDFDAEDRPALVTALLAACSLGEDAASLHQHWWQAPVGTRIAALLDLMLLSMPGRTASSLTVTLRCEESACGTRFDIDLPASAWTASEQATMPVPVQRAGGEPLLLRRPTGSDLRECRALALGNADPAFIARDLLNRLCLAGRPQPDDAERAAEALAQADPLVAFAVHCACPGCRTAADRSIDLEAHALQGLASRQRALLREVHRLASHYGWGEREIFEVPAARRARYLEAIAADAEDGR